MVVWLFVALVITQTYTANLTSMLTIQRLEPTVSNIEMLQSSNAKVGYSTGSFVERYLNEVLGFSDKNMKNFSSPDEFAKALRSKEIAAAFLEVPLANLLLARYCKEFIKVGPVYRVGGFAYVSKCIYTVSLRSGRPDGFTIESLINAFVIYTLGRKIIIID